jgi:hypothetical protein
VTVHIEIEPHSRALFDEILPLAQACWDESTQFKGATCAFAGNRDFKIAPDFDLYQRLEDARNLVILTLRDYGTLVGYLIGFQHTSLHHMGVQCALLDTMYIEPEFRSYTVILTEKFEKVMRERGVDIIGAPVHRNGPVYAVLAARGYTDDDSVMEKRIQ